MILQALNHYYERLADDQQDIAPYGFSRQKISFCAVVESDGTLNGFEQVVSEVRRGKPIPQGVIVPGQSKPSGAGINPCFLWDNATYMLGMVPEGRGSDWAESRFEAFRDRHLSVEKELDDAGLCAVCRFLAQWRPERIADHPELVEMTRSFGIFRLRGEKGYVHQRPAIANWCREQIAKNQQGDIGVCLVSCEPAVLAQLHEPKIKGVADAQSSGALLISFNLDAFESYGKSQSYNSPVSRRAAFQYATALNHLLADSKHRVQVGDATTVFWTERPTEAEEIYPSLFAGGVPAGRETEDDETLAKVRAFLDRLRRGKPDELAGRLDDPDTPFYILGLAPNAARLSVRYWLTGTLGQLNAHLAKHVRDLDIVAPDAQVPAIHDLLRETAPLKKGYPDASKIPKTLAGGLVRAVLTGGRYPPAFYAAILRRIRCEQFIDRNKRNGWRKAMAYRAAVIKACLIRNFDKEISMALDPDQPEPAYQLGRWFALLEKTQKDALGENINSTIKDRFYTAASSTPAAVFPRLIQLSQHHLKKIEKPAWRVTRERQVQEVADRLDGFPRRLGLEEQGLFHLGYYHQTTALYTKKSDNTETPDQESE